MAWCKLEDTFLDDLRFDRMARDLGVRTVLVQGSLARLMSWANRHRPDGDFTDLGADDLEAIMAWEGGPGALVASAMKRGVLGQRDSMTWVLIDYAEAQGTYAARLRKRKQRARESGTNDPEMSRDSHVTVPRQSQPVSRDSPVTVTPRKKEREEKIYIDPSRDRPATVTHMSRDIHGTNVPEGSDPGTAIDDEQPDGWSDTKALVAGVLKETGPPPTQPTKPLAYEDIERIGLNHLRMSVPGAETQRRLAALCPVDPQDWRAAVSKLEQVGARNFKYLAAVLESEKQNSRRPSRRPAARTVELDEPKPGYLSRSVDEAVKVPKPEEMSRGPPPGWADAFLRGEGGDRSGDA